MTDNIAFIKTIKQVGMRSNFTDSELSDILPQDLEEKVKEAAEVSMGTEISDEDIMNIQHLCDEIIAINEYRTHLYDYLKTRMMAVAPNLTVLVGETVGARLIAHAGSLVNLAKHPASTVQILGEFYIAFFCCLFTMTRNSIDTYWKNLKRRTFHNIVILPKCIKEIPSLSFSMMRKMTLVSQKIVL